MSEKRALRLERTSEPPDGKLMDALREVYRAAFSGPPHNESEEDVARFVESLQRHSDREGFRLVTAWQEERLVGFAYGYTSRAGQWWHDLITKALRERRMESVWLDGAFELVTLGVRPHSQRRGVGTALHDGILRDLPTSRAALSVRADTPAHHLYAGRGWEEIISPFVYPGGSAPCIIMRRAIGDMGNG